MAHLVFEQSKREATDRISEIDGKLEELVSEREALLSVVASLESYLDIVQPTSDMSLFNSDDHVTTLLDQPTWQIARDVLAKRGVPTTVPEIFMLTSALGVRSKPDAIRVAMLRKPEVFVSYGNGVYGLRAWLPTISEDEAEHLSFSEIREADQNAHRV